MIWFELPKISQRFFFTIAILIYATTCLAAPFLTTEDFIGNKPGCLDAVDVSKLNDRMRAYVESPVGFYPFTSLSFDFFSSGRSPRPS